MKKAFCIILALILCIGTLSACGKKDVSGKNFAVACYSMPKTLDPQIASSEIEKTIALNCFDTLLRPDENGALQCLSAESYSVSADNLVYTFKIRDGLQYFASAKAKAFIEEKGGEVPTNVTAYDYAFGITRGVLPETEADDYILLSNIKNADAVHNGEADKSELGVEAVDGKTLVITLEKPDSDFLFSLSQCISAPCNEQFFNLTGGRYGLEIKYTLFSGAFYVSNISADTSVTISKNSQYSGQACAVPNAVTFYLNSDISAAAAKVKKGTYDCAFVDTPSLSKLSSKENVQALTDITYSLLFNYSQARFSNFDLRKGLVCSADFSSVDNKADGIIAPDCKISGNNISNTGVSNIKFDVSTARECLKNAMAELGVSGFDIDIICTAETDALAKEIVFSWQKNVGVELNGTVSVCDESTFASNIAKKEFDIAIYPISASSSDAREIMSMFTSGANNNASGYSSEEYDRIFAELNENPVNDKLSYAQSFLIENVIAVPIYFASHYFVCSKGVSGIYFVRDSANVYFYKGIKQ